MKIGHLWLSVLVVVVLAPAGWGAPQEPTSPAGISAQGNHVITFKGMVKHTDGSPRAGTATVVFALYASQEGGDALWRETQVVQADAAGRYTVLLGATSAMGLPADAFGDGKAQWLAAQVEGEAELPRVLLVAVPYALKAADADTLGGRPAASFVLTENLAAAVEKQVASSERTTGASAVAVDAVPFALEGPSNTFYGTNAGNGSMTGLFDSFFGVDSGSSTTTGSGNSAFGWGAGKTVTSGNDNSMFGAGAGMYNTASNNAFFGQNAGNLNGYGFSNSFFGKGAGQGNTGGYNNSYFGQDAGNSSSQANWNAFFGYRAGFATRNGWNSFFGSDAGESTVDGYGNTFVGFWSGKNHTLGNDNTFLGRDTGASSTVEEGNILIGALANFNPGSNPGTNPVSNAAAIGYRAYVTRANSLVLGSIAGVNGATADTNVAIGTTAPVARLQVEGGETRLKNGNGSYTHFNYAGASVNYIRGATYFDSGNVGIGTAAPAARLHVSGGEMRVSNGNGTATHFNYVGTSINYVRGTTNFDNAPVYFTGGNIGIGTTAPSHPLQMGSGAHVTAGGVWTDASSRALKEAIRPLTLTDAERALAALEPVRYVYKAEPSDAHVGFIAEDVPDLVATPDRKSLAPMDLIAVLTKVVQDQQARLDAQEARLAELERLLQERR